MHIERRKALKAGAGMGFFSLLVAAGFVQPGVAWAEAYNEGAFKTKTLDETLKALGGTAAQASTDIVITAPDIAENGAVVPVSLLSRIPNTEQIALLVEKNPNMLAGAFYFLDGSMPEVNTRVKMGETSDIIAVVKADGKFYTAKKEVKVTLGGCGG